MEKTLRLGASAGDVNGVILPNDPRVEGPVHPPRARKCYLWGGLTLFV